MPAVDFLVAALFVVLGVVFSFGKGAFFIAGYNTLSREEKAAYDERALCKFMGKSMFALALSVFLWGLGKYAQRPILFNIGWIIFIGTILFTAVYAKTKNRFHK